MDGVCVGQGRERRVDGFERAYLSVGVGGDHLLDALLGPAGLRAITWLGNSSLTFIYQQP